MNVNQETHTKPAENPEVNADVEVNPEAHEETNPTTGYDINITNDPNYTKGCFQKKRGYIYCIVILLMMNSYRGMETGLNDTVSFILQENGASLSSLSAMGLSGLPWTFKIFFAFFFDVFFIKKIGKCKSYIQICGSLKVIGYTLLSAYVDNLVANLNVSILAYSYFSLSILLAMESIAIEAWVLTQLAEIDLPKGAIPESLGRRLGVFLTFNIFGSLNSAQMMKNLFHIDGMKGSLMSLGMSHFIVAVFTLVSMVFIIVTISERDVVRPPYKELLMTIPKFFTNRSTLGLNCFILLKLMAVNFFVEVFDNQLINKGYPRSFIIAEKTLLFPILVLMTFYSGRWLVRGQNLRFSFYCGVAKTLAAILQFIILWQYDSSHNDNLTLILLVSVNVCFCFKEYVFMYDLGFVNDVADVKIGGFYITFVQCFNNWSIQAPYELGLNLMSFTNFYLYSGVFQSLAIVSLPISYWYANILDSKPITSFKIISEEIVDEIPHDIIPENAPDQEESSEHPEENTRFIN